jgi:uncharacterized coiled-coil protein SlyX
LEYGGFIGVLALCGILTVFHRNDRLYQMMNCSIPELVAALSERISKLESQISSQPLGIIVDLKESIANHDRQLQGLRSRLSGLDTNLRKVGTDLNELKPGFPAPVSTPTSPPLSSSPTPRPIRPLRVSPPVSPSKSLTETEFPLKEAKLLDGIISYLTRKHGGNVHDKGIVTIASKSVSGQYAVRNVAELTSDSRFWSKNEPAQWVCWDFHEMRVRPTHYTIRSWLLKSWVVETSLDREAWTEIDRKADNTDFKKDWVAASFAVSDSAECRFIRLTQTGKSHCGGDRLRICAFEIFGALLE